MHMPLLVQLLLVAQALVGLISNLQCFRKFLLHLLVFCCNLHIKSMHAMCILIADDSLHVFAWDWVDENNRTFGSGLIMVKVPLNYCIFHISYYTRTRRVNTFGIVSKQVGYSTVVFIPNLTPKMMSPTTMLWRYISSLSRHWIRYTRTRE